MADHARRPARSLPQPVHGAPQGQPRPGRLRARCRNRRPGTDCQGSGLRRAGCAGPLLRRCQSQRLRMTSAVLGVDIGTSSSKGILVSLDGSIIGVAFREHEVDRPGPGKVEMEADLWWREFADLSRELLARHPVTLVGVGVSGMGPCVAVADADGHALRPAILYGVAVSYTHLTLPTN